MELTKLTPTGKPSTVTVSDSIFGVESSPVVLSQAVRVYLSNQRQGSAQAQTRGEVSRTKKKLYKQKGTGGARHGARSAPIFVGGGAAHGPTGNQNWSKGLSQKQKTLALCQSLSLIRDQIMVSDMLLALSNKTKHGDEFLAAVAKDKQAILLVFDLSEKSVPRVFNNIARTTLQTPERLTAYDVLRADTIIFTSQALQKLQTRLTPKPDKVAKQVVQQAPVAKTTVAVKSTTKIVAAQKSKTVSKPITTKNATPKPKTASKLKTATKPKSTAKPKTAKKVVKKA